MRQNPLWPWGAATIIGPSVVDTVDPVQFSTPRLAEEPKPPMSPTSSTAAVPGTQDSAPRVLQQFTSIFLVSRFGELWRVFDCDETDGTRRRMPSETHDAIGRVFVALTDDAQERMHAFGKSEDRRLEPNLLQAQLERSTRIVS